MSKPLGGVRTGDRNRAVQQPKLRRRTKRKFKPGKRKRRKRPHQPGEDLLNVACTRCEYRMQMKRMVFGRESRRASRCRCPFCGGNVVLEKYVDVHEEED